ncbi:adenylate/guanylate cyclase domain-containing protein [Leptolyngbya sp. PCC 6406]|uniref:adenylate/guanylate cyclase domain-containing protein n=1 Tax=Leptolyngbya sp. PCC 6406 TaxID=1173264 RepID=UPI0002AC2ACC|nr:adenylate/guanylate cyclase domain-containing protein [Leptolyngbya sp. PCC 6406]
MATAANTYRLPQSPSTLLIVHGDGDIVATLTEVLRDLDHVIVPASAHHLQDLLQDGGADLVLLSAQLPEVNSFDLCHRLKAVRRVKDVPILILGSGTDPDGTEAAHAFEAGANEYLYWPCHPSELIARVNHQLILYRRRQHMSQQNAMLLQEVRERKQIEQALRQAEEKYRSIFENANEGIFQTTEAGRYLRVNPALAQIFGYDSPEEMIAAVTDVGRQLYAQPKRREELMVYLQQFSKIVGAESEMVRRDGSHIWVSETIREVSDAENKFLYYEGIVHDITERRLIDMELRQQRQQADRLLVNILPYQIAQRLKSGTRTIAESFDDVTVLFADLVEFTAASGQMQPKELVSLLNHVFSTFDRLAERYQLEKIKTIGDAYMAAGGLPVMIPDHADAVALMALDMQQAMEHFIRPDGTPFRLRIGINLGPVIAGVIGMRKFAYDLWGDTVNMASRMETTGEAGRIQVTTAVYNRLKQRFIFESRGTISVKGGGLVETYWLVGRR